MYATTRGYGVTFGPPFTPVGFDSFGFGIMVSGRSLLIVIDGPVLHEWLPSNRFLEIWGMVKTSVKDPLDSTLSLPFGGSSYYGKLSACSGWPPKPSELVEHVECQLFNGAITLTRQ